MHRHLPYPEDGDALFHGTKEKWQGKGNQHNRCAIFYATLIMSSPTHTPQLLNVLFSQSSNVHPYIISMVMRVAVED